MFLVQAVISKVVSPLKIRIFRLGMVIPLVLSNEIGFLRIPFLLSQRSVTTCESSLILPATCTFRFRVAALVQLLFFLSVCGWVCNM